MFRGCGRTVPPSLVSIVSNIVRVPLAFFLSQKMGLTGLYWAVSITCFVRGVVIIVWRLLANRNTPREDAPLPAMAQRL